MKKKVRKLTLAKETVRCLVDRDLIAAQGGTHSNGCVVTADPEQTCVDLWGSERNC